MCRSHSFFHFLKYTHIACSFHPPVLVLAQNHRRNHSSCFSSLLCRWSSLSVPINIFASVSVPLSLCLCICPCLCLSDPFPFAWNPSRGLRIPGPMIWPPPVSQPTRGLNVADQHGGKALTFYKI